jgi:fatty acid desaturase
MSAPADRVLAATELHALSRRANLPGALRLGAHTALLLGTGGWLAVAGPWTVVPAFLAFGLIQVALFAPAHEMMHQTAFASRRANAIFGWLAACPSLLNLHFYTSFHLAHHRNTQIPGEDPELDLAPTDNLARYTSRVLGIPYWRLRLRVISDCWRGNLDAYPYVTAKATPGVITSVRAMSVVMVGGAAASALLFGWRTPLLFWIGPQLLCQPFLRAYVLAEHTGCTQDRNGLTNTRTTLTNAAVRLLMWNMPYHAEHHMYPSIPFHRLADAHAMLRARLGFVQRGYVRWHAGLLRQLRGTAPGEILPASDPSAGTP